MDLSEDMQQLLRAAAREGAAEALAAADTRASGEESRVVRELTGMRAQLTAIEARLSSLETRIGTMNLVDDATLSRFAAQAAHQSISEHIARNH
ncbi:hypothetical protein AB0G95_21765 [Streptomyces virginiae]|uniref:hypothetical protein n=1 Tax=Streptomyces virginiae TaxID=1961 RepID=UPI0034481DBE